MCKRYITASDVLLTFLFPEKGLFLCFFCHSITILLVKLPICLAGQNNKIRIDGKHAIIELLNDLIALCSADAPIFTDFCNVYIHLFIHRLIPPFFTSMPFENIYNYFMRTFLHLCYHSIISFCFVKYFFVLLFYLILTFLFTFLFVRGTIMLVKRIFAIRYVTCRITRDPPASGSLLMICHNRIAASQLIRSGLYHS